ncbi:MAG: hypothetical protein A2912_01415 [Candidatus Buchananbacteria bacterium RIFCSPLOWO2_01_FULL_40_23b]|uniref:DOD-type homing endonuclease domain-containing protein n=1 Tax=Candidatus Buchananbacteria bacterium RIFCSPLOWO2_01_FULL_40_23b TaxID=1797544 RepID=A0A1G1YS70_9BACT|nr:MAG: hypothetical protein A2912_01415 [Candidatus Buchananbacteria bacterium RIFCSPLOWO2_01_FULL_40_23b]
MLEQYRHQIILEAPDFLNIQEPEENKELLPHTRETAWLLSVLSFGATIEREKGMIEFKGKRNLPFIQSEQAREKLERTLQTPGIRIEEKEGERLIFQPQQEILDAIVCADKNSWTSAVQEKHPWVLESEESRWGLIEGVFDVKGGLDSNITKGHMYFYINDQTQAQLMLETLERNNVDKVACKYTYPTETNRLTRKYLNGIHIQSYKSRHYIATHITSVINEKEQKLDELRTSKIKENGDQKNNQQIEQNLQLLIPSDDLAWLLGVICTGGTLTGNALSIDTHHQPLLDKIKLIGERVFGVNAHVYDVKKRKDGTISQRIAFMDRNIMNLLGNLKSGQWTETIQQQHSWLQNQESRIWNFLTGIYEKRGNFTLHTRIDIYPGSLETADFIISLLNKVGIKHARLSPKQINTTERVSISNHQDVKFFSEHIHSVIPIKEELLVAGRNLANIEYKQSVKNRPSTIDEVVEEALLLIREFGTLPPSSKIDALRKESKTRFSPRVYVRRFGDGSMSSAREELMRIYRERMGNEENPNSTSGSIYP